MTMMYSDVVFSPTTTVTHNIALPRLTRYFYIYTNLHFERDATMRLKLAGARSSAVRKVVFKSFSRVAFNGL